MQIPDASDPERRPFSVPAGSPGWITDELIERTIAVWQRFYAAPLTAEDAVEMLMRVSHLLGVLNPNAALLKGT